MFLSYRYQLFSYPKRTELDGSKSIDKLRTRGAGVKAMVYFERFLIMIAFMASRFAGPKYSFTGLRTYFTGSTNPYFSMSEFDKFIEIYTIRNNIKNLLWRKCHEFN